MGCLSHAPSQGHLAHLPRICPGLNRTGDLPVCRLPPPNPPSHTSQGTTHDVLLNSQEAVLGLLPHGLSQHSDIWLRLLQPERVTLPQER